MGGFFVCASTSHRNEWDGFIERQGKLRCARERLGQMAECKFPTVCTTVTAKNIKL
jgi:hypothetical protein